MPFANAHGDWYQVTEDKIVNIGASVCSGSASSVQGTLSPRGSLLGLEVSSCKRNFAWKGILPLYRLWCLSGQQCTQRGVPIKMLENRMDTVKGLKTQNRKVYTNKDF